MSLHYVPAGVEVYSAKGQLTAVMEKNEKESTWFGRKFKQWHLPDRTVALTMTTTKESMNIKRPADVVVPVFGPSHTQMCGLTKVLVNPIHKAVMKLPFAIRGIKTIVDSGGFQLLKGTVPFVEPQSVVDNYNENADYGMPLDLPVRSWAEKEFFHAVSLMIKANDDWMLERLNKSVDLALISHGSTIERRKQRLDVLDRDANAVAVAGLNIKPPPGVDHIMNSAENLMYVLHRYRKRTTYFHVLGVTSKFWIFIYALISESKYVKEIGADSVSHRLSALAGLYDTYDFRSLQFPKDISYAWELRCHCPVCTTVNDARVIQNATLLESHNLWVRAQQTRLLAEMARAFINGTETLKNVHSTLQISMPLAKFTYVVNYVMQVISSDKWKALRSDNQHKSLFSRVSVQSDPVIVDRYKTVIQRYEKFHKKRFLNKG